MAPLDEYGFLIEKDSGGYSTLPCTYVLFSEEDREIIHFHIMITNY